MTSLANVSVFCFLASYLVAFGLEWTRLFRLNALNRAVMLFFGAAGLVAHTAYLIVRSGHTQLPPLLSSTHDWLLVLAWLGILLYLFLSLVDRNLPIGFFLLPIVLALIASAYFVSDAPNPRIVHDPVEAGARAVKAWAMLHAALLVFGIAGVLVGLTLSMMYLVQHRRLKQKQAGHEGLAFPSLERLARWNWWAVVISVPLLTLGMATGIGLVMHTQNTADPLSLTEPAILVNGVVWLVMVALFVWLLRADHPTGKKVAWFTLWACAFLLLTIFGLRVVSGGAHMGIGGG